MTDDSERDLFDTEESDIPKGYTCDCGHFNKFSPWVYAHWDIELSHTCEARCNRINYLLQGKVIYTELLH